MTLPSLINNNRNKALEAAFKKNYSVIEQALNMYYARTGERILPQNLGNDELKPILTKYMNVLQDCGIGNVDVSKACIKIIRIHPEIHKPTKILTTPLISI